MNRLLNPIINRIRVFQTLSQTHGFRVLPTTLDLNLLVTDFNVGRWVQASIFVSLIGV